MKKAVWRAPLLASRAGKVDWFLALEDTLRMSVLSGKRKDQKRELSLN